MISVIIPTYNEVSYLPATLDSVAGSNMKKEVIVVDAGSVDGTSDLARARDSRVLFTPWRQRAYQMNLGARHAQGRILLFLHADTRLRTSALDQIESALTKDRIIGGGFVPGDYSNFWFFGTTVLFSGFAQCADGWVLWGLELFLRQ